MKLSQKLTGMIVGCMLVACGGNVKDNTVVDVPAEDKQLVSPQEKLEAKRDNVNKPEEVNAQADGSLRLTAENGAPIGPEIKYMPEWRAFGWFTAADRVEWDVNVNKGGQYDVVLEWSVSDEEAGKEFVLEAKNEKLTGKVAKSGSWETFETENVGRIKLSEGKQKIVFKSKTKFDKGALLDLRELKLVPVM